MFWGSHKEHKEHKDDSGINYFFRNSGLKMLIPIVFGEYFNSILLKWLSFSQFLSPFVLSVAFLCGLGGRTRCVLLCSYLSEHP